MKLKLELDERLYRQLCAVADAQRLGIHDVARAALAHYCQPDPRATIDLSNALILTGTRKVHRTRQ